MAWLVYKGRAGANGTICEGRDPDSGIIRLELHAPDGEGAQVFLTRDEAWHLIDQVHWLLETTRHERYPIRSTEPSKA